MNCKSFGLKIMMKKSTMCTANIGVNCKIFGMGKTGTNIRVNCEIFGLQIMGNFLKGTNIGVNCEIFGLKIMGERVQISE